MRPMNSIAAPGLYFNCSALFQRRVDIASVSSPCAHRLAPLVYPSCASGYHRRALSQLSQRLHVGYGSAFQYSPTSGAVVSSATATESETLELLLCLHVT